MDNQTKIIYAEAQQLRNLFAQTGWSIVERIYNEFIKDISDIRTLKEGLPQEELLEAIRLRQAGAKILEEFYCRIKGNSELIEDKKKMKKNMNKTVKYHS